MIRDEDGGLYFFQSKTEDLCFITLPCTITEGYSFDLSKETVKIGIGRSRRCIGILYTEYSQDYKND